MSSTGWLAIYCGAILLASLVGGLVPFVGQVTHSRLQLYLSGSAGVMLGACFFHIMPEAMEMSGPWFGWWMALGAVGLFCIERFIAPHSHEVSSELQQEHAHEPGCEHDHAHRAAPSVGGWMAVLGLTIHTFMNGVGLAGAIKADADTGLAGVAFLPGVAMFLAIVLHKPADALAISTVLSRKGVNRSRINLVQLGFALMVPVGAGIFMLTSGAIAEAQESLLTGFALSFSAGTFLFIALSDLLPEVQFHRHDRVPLTLALVAGVLLMGGIGLLEGHDHGGHSHGGNGSPQGHDHHGHKH
jgi:zinc and cadmium transporter